MTNLQEIAKTSKAWPFEEARKLVKRYKNKAPKTGSVIFETGYGPSGLPHIGTFGEVARTTMVRNAFEQISDIPTRLICFSDDLDGMRKIPDNVPNPTALEQYLQKPLTSVPDPFGTHDSFGDHNNAILRRFLDTFGFQYEFYSATEFYKSGKFDEILLSAARNYDAIMEVMLASLREERRETYSCFLPISPKSGKVLYVPMKNVDGEKGLITYLDEDGDEITQSVLGGSVKLQWKPDFGARWAALGVDFEMYGKDHSTNTPIYDKICKILGSPAPEHFTYELFLDDKGEKISKSKGNGLSIDEWLTYASAESLSYFMYLKPKTAKRMHFDVIPRAVDEYHQQLRAFTDQDLTQQLNNPVFHIHNAKVPKSDMVISFSMLLNLASVSSAVDKDGLWGFIKRYAPEASPENNPQLDQAAGFAVKYFKDFVMPTREFRSPSEKETAALIDLSKRLEAWTGSHDAESLQTLVFSVGKDHNFDPLRDWFKGIYEVLFGASQGPRFGGFIALYGIEGTISLIKKALKGELQTPLK